MVGETVSRIPRKLHLIWVGDEAKRPDAWIETWRRHHADRWEIKIWGNAEYDSVPWICKRQMEMFRQGNMLNGVADIMRYEILSRHGGVYADADSESVRPLGDELLDNPMFAAWESERHMPGQISNSFIGSVPGHPVLTAMIAEIRMMKNPVYRWEWQRMRRRRVLAWKTVGPRLLTETVKRFPPDYMKIVPSALFLPRYFHDTEDHSNEHTYARHHWGTTLNCY